MDLKSSLWTLIFCSCLAGWFCLSLRRGSMNYPAFKDLYDAKSGTYKPGKSVINITNMVVMPQDYINSTNPQKRLNDLIQGTNFESFYIFDQHYSKHSDLVQSGLPVSNQIECGKQLDWIQEKLEAFPNYKTSTGQLAHELINYRDSFGRPDSGLYSGSVYWLGSYDLCSGLTLNSGKIKTRYCIGHYRFNSWPEREIVFPKSSIRVGICLPETCDTISFDHYKNKIEKLVKYDQGNNFDSLDLDSMFCLPDERSPIRRIPTEGRILLYVIGGWVLTVILFTCIYEMIYRGMSFEEEKDHRLEDGKSGELNQFEIYRRSNPSLVRRITELMSVRSSIKTFKSHIFRVRYDKGEKVRVDLSSLEFIKIFMALFIILAHSALIESNYTRTLRNKIDMATGEVGRLSMTVSRCVDIYFVIFGVLTSYTILRKLNHNQLSNPMIWLAINLGIFLRVGPLFLLIYWFGHSVMPYLGSGPWWDYGVGDLSVRNMCLNHPWWKSIPYLASFGEKHMQLCVLPGWFLVSYTQISLLLPLITYIISKMSGYAMRFSFIMFVASISALSINYRLYVQTVVGEEAFSLYGGMLFNLIEKYENTGYTSALGRLGVVAIGCLFGYLLRMYEIGKIERWPSWLRSKMTLVIMTIIYMILLFLFSIGHQIRKLTGHMASIDEVIITNFLVSLVWPIVTALFILMGSTVYNHTVFMRFLGHSFWRSFNKLGLCIFLVHWDVLMIGATSFESGPSRGYTINAFKLWTFGVVFSVLIALVVHILMEIPLSKITQLLAKPLLIKNNSKTSNCGEK